ncbi:hypothetical protein SSP24_78300 [Streptomyces spinoverrucosus]|uniref:Uncharacterized protein n=1 Tax=Streptomyces spinoverrucosus TaxID=284043 RepID=A0A4Y3VVN6_9ACTN|nr:hypothetical protein SSP24_78300 [Streptomyces spinoverrucosus]GHB76497.1 hypothetical protein GCM10010397_53810 [Streptomyces spinoverrucosus]
MGISSGTGRGRRARVRQLAIPARPALPRPNHGGPLRMTEPPTTLPVARWPPECAPPPAPRPAGDRSTARHTRTPSRLSHPDSSIPPSSGSRHQAQHPFFLVPDTHKRLTEDLHNTATANRPPGTDRPTARPAVGTKMGAVTDGGRPRPRTR